MLLSKFKPTTTRPKHNQLTWSTVLQALEKGRHLLASGNAALSPTPLVTSSHRSGLLSTFRKPHRCHIAMLATFSEGKYLHVETSDLFHASHVERDLYSHILKLLFKCAVLTDLTLNRDVSSYYVVTFCFGHSKPED
jgi:hypothetical protein